MDFDKKDGSGYLGGIPLKISSAFIPPPPVVLPPNTHELTLEKFQYDFSLEKKALECMNKMKEKVDCKVPQPKNPSNKLQNPSNMQFSDILLPKTPQNTDKVASSEEVNCSKINLSDFENDMSSPFDYMELQTINDLEELSSVFQGLKYNSAEKNTFSKSMSFPLENNDCSEENQGAVLPKVPFNAPDRSNLRVCKSYSDIHDLTSNHSSESNNIMPGRSSTPPVMETTPPVMEATPPVMEATPPVIETTLPVIETTPSTVQEETCDSLPDPYDELPEEDRRFVDAIADMGFPRAQVSRTVRHLGKDEKMVVEHLCQIQSLEECGYDCREAEAALHLHDYKQDQAKKFLDLISKFQDLGFEKDAVKKALIQNKNDWGKTIDALLS